MNKINYKQYNDYNESELLDLYKSVGWTSYTSRPETLKNAYKHSLFILAAYDEEILIGIIRVVGDGHSIIYIQDIIIQPNYQRKGIGSILLKEILEKYATVYQKILLTTNEEKTVQFYKSLGFKASFESDSVAFSIYNYN